MGCRQVRGAACAFPDLRAGPGRNVFPPFRPIATGSRRFFDLLGSGLLEVDFSVIGESEALGKLVRKYEDLSMSLADASLVRLAELQPGASVFTLDAHFRIYRKNGRQQIPVISP